ncbi:MAG: type II toxin-antitoxin system RelB/DinJ family antitoxin [Alphaproteobacteria bacterium]|nr:type II toxin-antitoxin system RelB/DinJ family antitoxin [Alphaproteobacteria bacterium]
MTMVIQTRIDALTKNKAEAILKRMGMSLSDGIRIFIHQVINENALPFRPYVGDEANEKLQEILEESEEEYQSRKSFGPFKSGAEVIASIMKE